MLARLPFYNAYAGKFSAWALADRDLLLCWAPVFLGVGIAAYFALGAEPSRLVVWALFVCAVFPALMLRPVRERFLPLWLFSTVMFWVASGVFVAQLRTDALNTSLLRTELKSAAYEGRVAAIDHLEQGKGMRILLEDVRINARGKVQVLSRARITLREPGNVGIADTVRGRATLFPPAAPVLPGAFDFQRHAYFQRIGAYGVSYAAPEIVVQAQAQNFYARMEQARTKFASFINGHLDSRLAPIAIALITGERAAIQEDDWAALRFSGLAHLLAISGLNVDMTAGIVFFVVRFLLCLWPWFVLHFPVKKIAAACALAAACAYVAFIVPSVPSQRALVMAAIVLIAVMLDRSPLSLRLLAITALAILLIWPEQLLSPSFQMSFAAVAALIAFYQTFEKLAQRLFSARGIFMRAAAYLVGVVVTTVIATIATAPFSLFHFQSLALYGVLANALAVPIMTFVIMPLATLGYALIPFEMGGLLLQAIGVGISTILAIAHFVASLPHAVWNPPLFPPLALGALVLSGLMLILLRGAGRSFALVPLAVCAFVVMQMPSPDIVIAPTGKQVLVRTQARDDVWALTKRGEKRWQGNVLQGIGLPENRAITPFPKAGAVLQAGDENLRCDVQSCLYQRDDAKIAFVRRSEALAEDCMQADFVVVLNFSVLTAQRTCKAPLIDRRALYRGGTTVLYVDKPGFITWENVAQGRGTRPWTVRNR